MILHSRDYVPGCSAVRTYPAGLSGTAARFVVTRARLRTQGARPAITTWRTDLPVACPKCIADDRHIVENLWARLNGWRAIASHYEKAAFSFFGFLCLAATASWPR
jgi:hypothetical protein